MTTFDGYRELMLGDYIVDERGRVVLREDYEAAAECREALQQEREEKRRRVVAVQALALGMAAVMVLLLVTGRI